MPQAENFKCHSINFGPNMTSGGGGGESVPLLINKPQWKTMELVPHINIFCRELKSNTILEIIQNL